VPTKRDIALAEIIETLEKQMQILESIGLTESASLLRIAWLDLECRKGCFSIAELEAFCARIAGAPAAATGRKKEVHAATARPSRARKRP
jgi:hypothetical protein